jgi:hypothetical protein
MAAIASWAGTRTKNPSAWWVRLFPIGAIKIMGKIWQAALIIFVLVFVISVEIAIFGWH